MKIKMFCHVLIVLCTLISCSINKLTNDITNIMSDLPNANEEIIEKLKHSDIVYIGSQSHCLFK
jgi:hypothetical protein